ncbi:ATPase involved in DNA repair [Methanosarcina lacustris Z-7289]|uniref:ATPase involved in DNA repair n=2 Tax=Methanosarcina lacustris TaxID=170861 RepID=A0A0E3S668_9EURY|nr:ATPase involved in DNA repair [Methanosarcina lacustris Z-7289]
MGAIVISGCVDSQAQPSTYKAPGDLYSSIFDPYTGFQRGGSETPDMHIDPHGPPPDMPSEGRGSAQSLQNAKLLLDENLEKAESISSRLDPGVQYLKEQGKDVSRLESLLEEYRGLVDEAKNYRALAASSSEGEDSSPGVNEDSEDGIPVESSEKEYLIQSQKSMIRANLVLKDIFDEFKRLMPGSRELKEPDRLSAEGEGRVTLMGRFDLNLHLQEGEMAVMELSPDSTINIEGDYTLEIKDGRQENMRIYHIQSADVKISGSHKMLLLSGENITVEADGEGYAAFFGNGTYSIEDADGIPTEEQWAVNSFFEEQMGPKESGRNDNKIAAVGIHDPETGIRETFLKKIRFIKENI